MSPRFLKLRGFAALCFIIVGGCGAIKPRIIKATPANEKNSITNNTGFESSGFTLGAGDEISLKVWRNDDLNGTYKISPEGALSLPLVGNIRAVDVSLTELQEKIRTGLEKYLVNPQVNVSIASTESQKVIVLGEVKHPGVFKIDGTTNIMEAISMAGGFTLDANQGNLLLIRGNTKKAKFVSINLEEVFSKGNLYNNVSLHRGDVIYVSETFIANVDRFVDHFRKILLTAVNLETGIVLWPRVLEAIEGDDGNKQGLTIPLGQ